MAAATGLKIAIEESQLNEKLSQLGLFTEECSHLLPPGIGAPEILARLDGEVPEFISRQAEIARYLTKRGPLIALCH